MLDHWLISPQINVAELDTISFYIRALEGTTFDDSISVYLSTTGGSNITDFDLAYDDGSGSQRYLVPKGVWSQWSGNIPLTGTIRIAIRYHLFDANTNAEFIGIDLVQVFSSGGGTAYPQNILLTTNQGFGDHTQSSSFRMIGLPGNINIPLSQILTGSSGTDWVAFYDNGAVEDSLVEFNSSSIFNFSPGKGFWILSKNNFSINQQTGTVTLAGDNSYSIPLHNGWNIISNPFEINVSWASIQAANSISESLHDFIGSYSQPPGLAPYKGYYYFNASNAPTLKIPYIQSAIAKNSISNILAEKSLKIFLLTEEKIKSNIEVGIDENAKDTYDVMDKFSPPGNFAEYSLSIMNPNLETSYKYLISDFRKGIDEGQVYDLILKSVPSESVTFKIEGSDIFQEYNLLLLSESNSKVYDLKNLHEFEIQPVSKLSNYKLVIGTNEFVSEIKSGLIPDKFSLAQNFPNPFNPETVINYFISENSLVTLKVFDVLGNEVSILVNEVKTPGRYEIIFDGHDLSSGVYFYRLESSNYIQTNKMILLK
jgi:hypothetical protein